MDIAEIHFPSTRFLWAPQLDIFTCINLIKLRLGLARPDEGQVHSRPESFEGASHPLTCYT